MTERSPTWQEFRKKILSRDNNTCIKCGRDYCGLTVDHITPLALGGLELDPKNCQTLCLDCKSDKDKKDQNLLNKKVKDWKRKLAKKQQVIVALLRRNKEYKTRIAQLEKELITLKGIQKL